MTCANGENGLILEIHDEIVSLATVRQRDIKLKPNGPRADISCYRTVDSDVTFNLLVRLVKAVNHVFSVYNLCFGIVEMYASTCLV